MSLITCITLISLLISLYNLSIEVCDMYLQLVNIDHQPYQKVPGSLYIYL